MKNDFEAMGVVGLIGGGLMAAWAYVQTKKMRETANKLDMSLEDIASRTPVDIQKDFLDKAVARAVDREVHSAVQTSSKFVTKSIKSDMDSLIRKDVNAAYNSIRGGVEKKVTAAVSEIDTEALKNDIREKVGNKMVEQLWNMSGVGKMLGNSSSSNNNVDYEALKQIIDSVPYNQRADVLSKIMGK